jgi:hypothetical protein
MPTVTNLIEQRRNININEKPQIDLLGNDSDS